MGRPCQLFSPCATRHEALYRQRRDAHEYELLRWLVVLAGLRAVRGAGAIDGHLHRVGGSHGG